MSGSEKSTSESSKGAIPLKLLKTRKSANSSNSQIKNLLLNCARACNEDMAFVKRSLTSPMKRSKGQGAPGYRRDVAYATMRELLGELGAEQVQFLTPTTDKMYKYVAKSKGKTPKSVTLPEFAQGHWVGNPQAHYVMLFSHGKLLMGYYYVANEIDSDITNRRWILRLCDCGPSSLSIHTTEQDGKGRPRLFDLRPDLHIVTERPLPIATAASCLRA